jgi:hypothetical protein
LGWPVTSHSGGGSTPRVNGAISCARPNNTGNDTFNTGNDTINDSVDDATDGNGS